MFLTRFGGDLLSHVLRRSTIGATALNGRVRDGTGCFACAMATKPGKSLVMCVLPPGGLLEDIFCPIAYRLVEDGYLQPSCSGWGLVSKSVLCVLCMLLICSVTVLLLLDQIKPIGPLVPVN